MLRRKLGYIILVAVLFSLPLSLAYALGFYMGFEQAIEHSVPTALKPNYDSVVVHATRWPKRNDPMCSRCMPSNLTATIPVQSSKYPQQQP